MHGEQDGVMPIALAEAAERALRALGADTTLERFAGLGHGIDARVAAAMAQRLLVQTPPSPAAMERGPRTLNG